MKKIISAQQDLAQFSLTGELKTFSSSVENAISQSELDRQTKQDIIQIWHVLSHQITDNQLIESLEKSCSIKFNLGKGCVTAKGNDATKRALLVNLQGAVELAMVQQANKTIHAIIEIIHTPMPATPLCLDVKHDVDPLNESRLQDPSDVLSMTSRPEIMRALLDKLMEMIKHDPENNRLVSAFPHGGQQKREDAALKQWERDIQEGKDIPKPTPMTCFNDLRDTYSPALLQHVTDIPLSGATAKIRFKSGKEFGWAIDATQANSPSENDFSFHFGPLPIVNDRITIGLELMPPLT